MPRLIYRRELWSRERISASQMPTDAGLWPNHWSSLPCCVAVRREVAPALFERPLALRGSGSGAFAFWECLPDARRCLSVGKPGRPQISPVPCGEGSACCVSPALPPPMRTRSPEAAYAAPRGTCVVARKLRAESIEGRLSIAYFADPDRPAPARGGGGQPRPVMRRRKSAKRAGSASDKSRSVTVKLP